MNRFRSATCFLVLFLGLHSTIALSQAPRNAMRSREITELAELLVRQEKVAVWPVVIEIGQRTMNYKFPPIRNWNPGTSAHQTALAHELVIQSIRDSPRPQQENRFWDETFRQVRARIQGILDEASRMGDRVSAKSHMAQTSWLAKSSFEIGKIYDQRMEILAQQYQVVIVNETLMESFIVQLNCDPPGGTIQIIPAGHWELYKLRKKIDPSVVRPAWRVLQQGGVSLYGQNYVHVTWGNGSSFGPELVRFQINQRLVFTPSGPRLEQAHRD